MCCLVVGVGRLFEVSTLAASKSGMMADLGGYVDSNTLEQIQRCEEQVFHAENEQNPCRIGQHTDDHNVRRAWLSYVVAPQIRQRIPRGSEGIRVHRYVVRALLVSAATVQHLYSVDRSCDQSCCPCYSVTTASKAISRQTDAEIL